MEKNETFSLNSQERLEASGGAHVNTSEALV